MCAPRVKHVYYERLSDPIKQLPPVHVRVDCDPSAVEVDVAQYLTCSPIAGREAWLSIDRGGLKIVNVVNIL